MDEVKETYQVTGMTCSGCERTVQKIVSAIPGVIGVMASAQSGDMTVDYDRAKVNPDQIRMAVSRVGYTVGEKKN